MSSWLLLVIVVPGFAAVWLAIASALGGVMKMTYGERRRRGEPRRSSGWGSADVNGIYCRNCLRLDEYDDGYLLRSMWLFGGGEIWLPRDAVKSGEQVQRFLSPLGRRIVTGPHRVTLYGRLLNFVRHRD